MILGIHDGHDAGAALIDVNKIIAVNEERLSREKYHRGFPELSVKKVLEISDKSRDDIEKIAVAGIYRNKKRLQTLMDKLEEIFGPVQDKVVTVEHHLAHATSAYFTCGREKSIVLTIDAAGDGLSSGVYLGDQGDLKKIAESSYLDSLGDFYASITEMLGYRPMRDEGKVMSLSGYGDENNSDLSDCISVQGLSFKNHLEITGQRANERIAERIDFPYNERNKIKDLLEKGNLKHDLSKQAIKTASSAQNHVEKLLNELSKNIIDREDIDEEYKKNIAYSGGVAQNVKGNVVIRENFPRCWVFPHMGDGGLALGAALYVNSQLNEKYMWDMSESVENVYLGPEYKKEEIEAYLKNENIDYEKVDDRAERISALLLDGKIVSLFQGKMEYGPRALGNRSIIADPSSFEIKERLNNALGREPFQPFAPTILDEYKEIYLKEPTVNKFMTTSFEVTQRAKEEIPAVIHVDGTTRPQILKEVENEQFYNIVKKFEQMSGIGSVLNTSFNMHGEPIVCSPEDAVNSFRKSQLDYLFLDDLMIESV
ncbi:MAG: carbamoyltransferase C-terminal domain-containing protein [Candidatus Natronoplasma sp.]